MDITHLMETSVPELRKLIKKHRFALELDTDNEWLVTNEIDRAHQEKKGLVILGIRRFAKSVIEASYVSWGATFDENSEHYCWFECTRYKTNHR